MQSLLPWPATQGRRGGQAVRAVCASLVLGSGEASDLGASTIPGYYYVKIFIVAAVAMVILAVLALIFACGFYVRRWSAQSLQSAQSLKYAHKDTQTVENDNEKANMVWVAGGGTQFHVSEACQYVQGANQRFLKSFLRCTSCA